MDGMTFLRTNVSFPFLFPHLNLYLILLFAMATSL